MTSIYKSSLMLAFKALLFFAFSVAGGSVGLSQKAIPAELEKKLLINSEIKAAIDFYEAFSKTWVSDVESDQNMLLGFDRLKKIHEEHSAAIEAMEKKYVQNPTKDSVELDKLMREIEKDAAKQGAIYARIAEADRKFIHSMNDLADSVHTSTFLFQGLKKRADDEDVKKVLQSVIDSYKSILTSIDEMHGYILKSSELRRNILSLAVQRISANLKRRYAKVTNQKLSTIKKAMEKVLKADRFYSEVRIVADDYFREGIMADWNLYGLYQPSIRYARAGVMKFNGYMKKFEKMAVKGRQGVAIRSLIQNQIELYSGKVNEYTKAGGWPWFFEAHVALAEATLEEEEEYTEECIKMTKDFLVRAKAVVDLETYLASERRWVPLFKECEGVTRGK